jgi:hypothetical protein
MLIVGIFGCIMQLAFWLIAMVICIPFLCIIAIPLFFLAVCIGTVAMDRGLTAIDEDT